MDIGVANSGTNNIGIFLGFGNISFSNQSTYPTGVDSSPYSLSVGDFNNDTLLDIVVANYGSDNVGIFFGCSNGSFTNQITYSTDLYSSPYSVVVGDLNNDMTLDIVVATYDNSKLNVFIGDGNGIFDSINLFLTEYGSHPFSVIIGDFNNDEKLDLALANNGTDSLSVFLQTC